MHHRHYSCLHQPFSRLFLHLSLLVFLLAAVPGFAWVIHLDVWNPELLQLPSGTILLLDPDEISTEHLDNLYQKGVCPLAWLNVGFHEPGRSFWAALEARTLTLSGKPPTKTRFPVRFFSGTWKRVLSQRIQEIANIGFRGLFLTGLDASQQLTDHPFAPTEMLRLCESVALRFRGLTPHPYVVVDLPLTFPVSTDLFTFADSICLKGIWYADPRRPSRPWEREPHLTRFFQGPPKPLLTIDDPPQAKQESLKEAISALGADSAFFPLPLYPIRSRIP